MVIFLLYGGESVDGRGDGKFIRSTTDVHVAKRHWDNCKKNPYSTGYVKAVSEDREIVPADEQDWHDFLGVA